MTHNEHCEYETAFSQAVANSIECFDLFLLVLRATQVHLI